MIDSMIDGIQEGLVYFTLALVGTSIVALLLFDTMAGAGIMYYLSSENWLVALGISFATSGLLIMLMVLFYSNQESPILFIAVSVVFLLDVVFDSLSADVLRFGKYVNLTGVPDAELHWMFRILIGGISTFGDAVALAIIVGMSVIKDMLHKALPKKRQSASQPSFKSGISPSSNTNRPQQQRPTSFPPGQLRPNPYPPPATGHAQRPNFGSRDHDLDDK